MKYAIDMDLGISVQDEHGWRSLWLESRGNTLYEMIDNATISAINQDGEECWTVGIYDEDESVQKHALEEIQKEIVRVALKEAGKAA